MAIVIANQTEIPQINGNPNNIYDGPCGIIVEDVVAGQVYKKRSPLGTKTGWKRLLDEDDVAGGGGATVLTGVGAPAGGLGIVGSLYVDDTTNTERLYFKASSGWIIAAGVALFMMLLTIAGARAADPYSGNQRVVPRSAVESATFDSSWINGTNPATKGALYNAIINRPLNIGTPVAGTLPQYLDGTGQSIGPSQVTVVSNGTAGLAFPSSGNTNILYIVQAHPSATTNVTQNGWQFPPPDGSIVKVIVVGTNVYWTNAATSGSGSIVLQTNPQRIHDFSALTDDTYAGDTIVGGNAGEALTQWDVVYLSSSSTWLKGNAATAGKFPAVGVVVATTSNGAPATVLTRGIFRDDGGTVWTPGGTLFLSDSTAGAMTQTAPTTAAHAVQSIGTALTAHKVQVFCAPIWFEN